MMVRLAIGCLLLCLPAAAVAEGWQRHTVDRSSRGADGVRLSDVNGDGLLDVATGWEEGGLIRVYVNPGPRRARDPWPAVTVGRVRSPEDAVLIDLDGDGATDVVSCCEGSERTVYVHWAPADPARFLEAQAWQTEPITCTAGQQMWMFALPMDIDGQRGIDLVVGSKGSGASIGWLQSPAPPRALHQWRYWPLQQAGWIMSLVANDLDEDGDPDVLASDRKGNHRGIFWLENPGMAATREGHAWSRHSMGAGDREVMFLSLADRDVGGGDDLFCAVRGRGISHLRRETRGDSWALQEIPMPDGCGTGKAVAVGDIDGDGRNDLVFSCENALGSLSGVRWLRSNPASPASWTDHEISGEPGTKYDLVQLIDLDADGDLDLLTCEESENLGVVWYENPSREASTTLR